MKPLRICLIASSRFPVAEPFVGGLEAHTHSLVRELLARGHDVTLFAGPGSDPSLGARELDVETVEISRLARADVSAGPEEWMREHHAYLSLMLDLARSGRERFDVVHNNSLHHLPIAMAAALSVPMVTTLHTPPTPWLESAITLASEDSQFVSVSAQTARAWSHATASTVVLNGVDVTRWKAGPGGPRAIWYGRFVPEKAPHLAIRAAMLAGIAIDLAGPILDVSYYQQQIEPLLGDHARYVGHLTHSQLTEAVGHACVTIVTPQWDEPYGLIAAESLACGTPVAAFARGALPEILDSSSGRLASPGDLQALARAAQEARNLSRTDARARAIQFCSLDRMVTEYEEIYAEISFGQRAA